MVQYSRDIDIQLDDGETERFVVQTFGDDAVRVDLSGDGSPYDVDIQTAGEHPTPANFNPGEYMSCLPLGSEMYTDTSEHTTATEVVDESVFVAVTNNSGSPTQFSGTIQTHSHDSRDSAASFTTSGTGSRASGYRDGLGLRRGDRGVSDFESTLDDGKEFDARVHLIEGGFGDIGAAINDLLSRIQSDLAPSRIVVPRPRSGDPATDGNAWNLTTPISAPYIDSSLVSGIAIVAAPGTYASVGLTPDFASDGIVFKKEEQTDTGDNQVDSGFMISGFRVFDKNDVVTKFVEINDTDFWIVENNQFIAGTPTTHNIDVLTPNRSGGSKFGRADYNVLTIQDGTALRLKAENVFETVADVTLRDQYVRSPNDGTGIGFDIQQSGRFKVYGADISSVDKGVRLRGYNAQGFIHGLVFEGGYGIGSSVVTPYDIGDNVGIVSIDSGQTFDSTRDTIRESFIRTTGVEFQTGPKPFAPLLGGGAGFDPRWSAEGTNAPVKDSDQILFQTGASTNDESRVQTGGGPAQGMVSGKDLHRFDAHMKLNDISNIYARMEWYRDSINRVQLVADPENTAGEGITANWMARILSGGDNISGSPVDTGVPIDTNFRLFSIISERKESPYDYRFAIDDQEVAFIQGHTQGPSGFRISLRTEAAAQKEMEVHQAVPRQFETLGRKTLL
jgi:hypothetical protein